MFSPYLGTKKPEWADPNKSEFPVNLGIYKGVVKQIDTGTRTSRVFVFVSEFGGNDQDNESNWNAQVSYASPFGGYTSGLTGQSGNNIIARNDFYSTQQTYGFFMSPPDVGSQVLCCFPNGNRQEGYWFACVNPNLSQHMLPATGALPLDMIDPVSIPADLAPYLTPGAKYPVSEFNQLSNVYTGNWAANALRPIHIPQTINLIRQGLDADPDRGAISSSGQRDPVSAVYGFSTPGRPYGTQDPANDVNLTNKIASGNFNPADYTVTTRVGGHSLVLDDGDLYGKSNLVRLKSSAGHQILLNDSKGFIYISNSNGTAWVELTATGDILVYGANDFSLRTQGNIMLQSDHNINLDARGSINMYAGASIKSQARSVEAFGTSSLNLYGRSAQLASGGQLSVASASGMSVRAGGRVSINGTSISLNGSGGAGASSPPAAISRYKMPDAVNVSSKWEIAQDALTSINYKIPTHEPYIRGSIASVVAAQEEYAAALANALPTGSTTTVDGVAVQPPLTTANGPDNASLDGITRAAPSASFIKQPDPGVGLGSLNNDQLRAYMAQTGYSESNGNYTAVNQFGYMGKYQLGSLALQDLGYIKPGTAQTPEAMNNPSNWTGKNGVTSSSDFLNNSGVQESAMYDYTKANYSRLQRKGIITAETTPDVVAGVLSASHLVGPGGAAKWYTSGQTVSDANGTTAAAYYNRGRYSQTQVDIITASNSSKSTSNAA